MIYCQIIDGKIKGIYCEPQDPTDKPGYTEIDDLDPRYIEYLRDQNDHWWVSKLTIVRRLTAAGQLATIMAIRDADPVAREEWLAATVIISTDQAMRALLAAGGADPDIILARED